MVMTILLNFVVQPTPHFLEDKKRMQVYRGISIPSVFLFQGYLNRYGLQQWGRERYATLQTKAGACIRCGACEPRCPYNLPIRQMMQKAAGGFGSKGKINKA